MSLDEILRVASVYNQNQERIAGSPPPLSQGASVYPKSPVPDHWPEWSKENWARPAVRNSRSAPHTVTFVRYVRGRWQFTLYGRPPERDDSWFEAEHFELAPH